MALLTPTSRLEAVNEILANIGRQPITSLASGPLDAALAERRLDVVNRKVQLRGWHFNTEYDVEFPRDENGEIYLPSNCLKADVNKYLFTDINPVIRGNRFYDVLNRTYEFSEDLTGTVVYLLEFTNLPEAARYYITTRAAREFQDKYFKDSEVAGISRQDELDAYDVLIEAELESGDYNIFNSYDTARPLRRGTQFL